MANETEYYYDLTPDVEDINNVLIDLVDILNKNSDKSVVIRVQGDDRNYFDLGEGGGQTDILGLKNQLVAADGEGKAIANIGAWFSETSKEVSELSTAYSVFEIKGTGKTLNRYYAERTGPFIRIEDGGIIQLLANGDQSPVLSMTDNAVIEMGGIRSTSSVQNIYNRNLSDNSVSWLIPKIYSKFNFPFGKDKIYPYFHMGQSSTIVMEGCAILKMAHGSCILTEGNATIDVKGAGSPGDKDHPSTIYGETYFGMMPGSYLKMQSSDSVYGPLILMESQRENSGGQIILTTQRKMVNSQREVDTYNPKVDEDFISPPIRSSRNVNISGNYPGPYGLYFPSFTSKSLQQDDFINPQSSSKLGLLSYLQQPTLAIQGKTNIIIGDEGLTEIRLATYGALTIDHTHNTGSNVDIKIGAGENANLCIDFGNDDDASTYYKICPAKNSNTMFMFEPKGFASFQIAPESIFAVDITPRTTYAKLQWENLTSIIESQNAFLQTNGNWHIENFSGNFILRGSRYYSGSHGSQSAEYWEDLTVDPFDPNNPKGTHLNKDWHAPIFALNPATDPTLQLYDGSNLYMAGETTAPSNSDNSYLERKSGVTSPIFEMLGTSDLRLHYGGSLDISTDLSGITTVTFKTNNGSESPVSFTLTQLAKLKELLDSN